MRTPGNILPRIASPAAVLLIAVVVTVFDSKWPRPGRAGVAPVAAVSRCMAAEPASGEKARRAPAGPEATSPAQPANNDQCYVCHLPFTEDKLASMHARQRVWCIKCHGLSAGHMSDETIGATPPDRVFKKDQVEAMCAECHEKRDHPALKPADRTKRLADSRRAQEEIKGCKVDVRGVCTDCHGTHWIPPKEDQLGK